MIEKFNIDIEKQPKPESETEKFKLPDVSELPPIFDGKEIPVKELPPIEELPPIWSLPPIEELPPIEPLLSKDIAENIVDKIPSTDGIGVLNDPPTFDTLAREKNISDTTNSESNAVSNSNQSECSTSQSDSETENTSEEQENTNEANQETNDGVKKIPCRNEYLEGQTHPETGVPFERKTVKDADGNEVDGVFPVFDSVFDAYLPDNLLKASDKEQFAECNAQLKKAVNEDPELKKKFTPEQLEQIENGETPDGYTWHHNEETGKMELVETSTHAKTGHTGGKAIWGGGSENR